LEKIGLEHLSVVISLQDMHLHRNEVVLEKNLTEVPESWELPRETRDRFAWRSGVQATVALVLNADRQIVVGEPFLRGHWLERKVFSIRSKSEPLSTFPIEKWPADEFVRRHLPSDSVYWIEFISDDFNQRFEDPGEALHLALRDNVYDTLADNEQTPAGKAVLALILAEVVTDILWIGLKNLTATDELQRGGVLHGVLDLIRKSTGTTREQLTRYTEREEGRAWLRANVQAALGSRREIAKLGRMS
jgi:hypothetical protein